MRYMEIIANNAIKFKNKPILADDNNKYGITYEKVDEISGKIYAYLQDKHIGKEDFVMICLPRSVKPLIAMLGVWKNGSAFVLVEDNYAPERIEFIKKDCGCKLVIDMECWEEIQKYEPKNGFEETSLHDAAFAVYTSGTTGNPKGVIHEYGNIDRMLLSVDLNSCAKLATEKDRFALVAPLNFIASLLIMVKAFELGAYVYVVPYKTLKNPLYIGMFIATSRITGTFLTPSHIRRMNVKLPGLHFCIIGSEPANEVYLEGLLIHNFYLMSESGFAVTHFLIDKLYEQTPIGNSEFGHKIYLLDEDGKEVQDGEKGEICFENDFVRGYINLPEQTKQVFKDLGDGKGRLYCSGDLAKKDEKGRLVICGRISDMVKINGNRVEPGEIEEVAKKILKIDWAAARIFDDGKRVFIALYYKDKIHIEPEKIMREMSLYLPYYMIPAFFIHIDEIPLRPNGKMDRKALPKPNFEDYKETYVAPRNDIEKALCDSFAKVLGMDKVGIEDDFYKLGGDSLASMEVVADCNLQGIRATQIFRGRTVKNIAQIYEKECADLSDVNIDKANQLAMTKEFPLTTEQAYMFDYQLYSPVSTMYNLCSMTKLDKNIIDMKKLAMSVDKAIQHHPALLTTFFFNKDGEVMQKYSPEKWKGIEVEKISEKELNELKDDLIKPFKMTNELLFHCRIFETEEAGYLFVDVHHTLFDGVSSQVFIINVLKLYYDQAIEPDYYYFNIEKREKLMLTDTFKKCKEYFDNTYFNNGTNWQRCPKIDHKTRENENDDIIIDLDINKKEYERLLAIYSLTPNAFFITASILATAFYNKYKNIIHSWIYNGRSSVSEMSSVGLLFRNLPVGIKFNPSIKIKDLYYDIVNQINNGIEHSCYSPVELNSNVVEDDMACVLYQSNMKDVDTENMPGLLGEVDIKDKYAAAQNVLDIEILDNHDGLKILFDFASKRYDKSSMEKYTNILSDIIKILLEEIDNDNVTVKEVLAKVGNKNKLIVLFKKIFTFGWLN